MFAALQDLAEAHEKSQRLLESLGRIPALLADDEVWNEERRSIFGLLRRGLVDCITGGCLEAPIFGNRQIEDAFVFLLTVGLRHEKRRDNVLTCFKCLRTSESWSMALRGSLKFRKALKDAPDDFRLQVLDAADAAELQFLLSREKRRKARKSAKAAETNAAAGEDAPVPCETGITEPVVPQEDALAENSVSQSMPSVELPETQSKESVPPEDLLAENSVSLAENSVSQSNPSVELPIVSRTCGEAASGNTPACSSACWTQRPPRPDVAPNFAATTPTPQRVRNFGGGTPANMTSPSPASVSKRRDSRRARDFEELGPRCPNGKGLTRADMMREGEERRRAARSGSATPGSLRRLLSRGAASPKPDASPKCDTPSSLLGRMREKLLPSRPVTPSPAARSSRRAAPRDYSRDRFSGA